MTGKEKENNTAVKIKKSKRKHKIEWDLSDVKQKE